MIVGKLINTPFPCQIMVITSLEHDTPTKTLLVSDITTVPALERMLTSQPGTLVFPYTQVELELVGHYVPSTYHRIATGDNGLTLTDLVDEPTRRRQLALQLESEVSNRSSTIDGGITHGRCDVGTVRNKLYHFNRLCTIADLLGVPHTDRFKPEDLADDADLAELMIEAKIRYAHLLSMIPGWTDDVELRFRDPTHLDSVQQRRFCYAPTLIDHLGDDLVGLVVYGSAAKEQDDAKVGDYDHYVLIRPGSFRTVYAKLRALDDLKHPADGKPVGVNLIEEPSFPNFMRWHHDPRETLEHAVVLHGQVAFPVVGDQEIQERGVSYALLRAKTLKSTAAWAVTDEPFLASLSQKPALFEYFQKTVRFLAASALNLRHGVRSRTKETIDAELARIGTKVFPYHDNVAYARRTMLSTALSATKLLHEYFPGKRFEAPFIKNA